MIAPLLICIGLLAVAYFVGGRAAKKEAASRDAGDAALDAALARLDAAVKRLGRG